MKQHWNETLPLVVYYTSLPTIITFKPVVPLFTSSEFNSVVGENLTCLTLSMPEMPNGIRKTDCTFDFFEILTADIASLFLD